MFDYEHAIIHRIRDECFWLTEIKLECLKSWKYDKTRYVVARLADDQGGRGVANCFVSMKTIPNKVTLRGVWFSLFNCKLKLWNSLVSFCRSNDFDQRSQAKMGLTQLPIDWQTLFEQLIIAAEQICIGVAEVHKVENQQWNCILCVRYLKQSIQRREWTMQFAVDFSCNAGTMPLLPNFGTISYVVDRQTCEYMLIIIINKLINNIGTRTRAYNHYNA